MRPELEKELLMLELEIDQSRWEVARERAEEIIKDLGWSEKDDDYLIQLEDETKRQWDEEYDRYMFKRRLWVEDEA
jgi:hypothetical protein